MVNINVSSYESLFVCQKDKNDETEVFVSNYGGDYHLIGSRERSVAFYISERTCIGDDIGVLVMQDGKSLVNLVEGEILTTRKPNGESHGPFDGWIFKGLSDDGPRLVGHI